MPATLGAAVDARGSRAATPSTGLPSVEYGKPSPDFAYDTGNGERKLSDLQGAPVLVHFWDSWCGPCTDELPLLVRAHKENPAMTIVTISDEDPGVARSYLKEQGL
ncbi:MAG: TlpA family protein disulfide reductase, partial [Candidatus Eremiobacteraeota bacterium]|nr:TlpA family protein disulfide reductase [Candidatus Eremiobacteraeota bacterium]